AGALDEATRLEQQSMASDFWDQPSKAQTVMKRIAELRERATKWTEIQAKVRELSELVELAAAEEDSSLEAETDHEIAGLQQQLADYEFELNFSGPYDD